MWAVNGNGCKSVWKKPAVQTYSCKKSWWNDKISDSDLPSRWEGLHHPCYLPIYFTGSMRVRRKLFSCPLYPLLKSPSVLNPHPSQASYQKNKQTKNLTGSTYCFSPPYWGYLEKEKVLDSVHKYSWTSSSLCLFCLIKSPWRFWCGVCVPGWRSRHTGWGHIGR